MGTESGRVTTAVVGQKCVQCPSFAKAPPRPAIGGLFFFGVVAMEKTWKAGDKVKLTSGGPDMMVLRQHEKSYGDLLGTRQVVTVCQWFDGAALSEGEFAPASLESVTGTKDPS